MGYEERGGSWAVSLETLTFLFTVYYWYLMLAAVRYGVVAYRKSQVRALTPISRHRIRAMPFLPCCHLERPAARAHRVRVSCW